MHTISHDAPQVREASLTNTLNAYYVAPRVSHLRDPTNNDLFELAHTSSSRKNTEASLPLSLLSSLANVFDKPVEDDGPGLRKIILPAPPTKSSIANRAAGAPFQRRRQRRAAMEASASAAAAQTLQRQQEQQELQLRRQKDRTPSAFSRGRAHSGLSLEAWQPPYQSRNDSATAATAAETPVARKITKVTSPHAASSTGLAVMPQPSLLETDGNPSLPQRQPTSSSTISSNKPVNHRASSAASRGEGEAKLAWRLRRRSVAVTCAPNAFGGPSTISSLLDRQKNPLDVLRHLGSATFNDAPLHTFLSSLDLRLPSSRSSTGTGKTGTNETNGKETAAGEQSRWHTFRENDRRRRRSSRQRTDAVAVHLGDVEARSFRVEVVAGEASPLQALVEAYRGSCSWDGSEFSLVPLEDRPRVPLDAVVSPHLARDVAQLLHDEGRTTPSGVQTASLSFGAESQNGLDLPGMPMTFLRSANNSFETPDAAREDGRGTSLEGPQPPLASGAAGAEFLIDGPVFGRAVEGPAAEAEVAKSVVPCWKRFSTTAALYLTLGDAGCCDTAYFPYPAVQLCTWGDLVAQQQTRIEMMASCSAAALHTLQAARCDKKADPVAVAVMFPTSRKGVMRRPLSLTTQPFTDAEVFQLFYLQLIFRAYFDVRFPALGFRLPGQAEWHVRSDFLAVRSSGPHGVAFEHPLCQDTWLRFPPHSRLLTLLCLKEAIVPLYATPAELQESAVLPLFGGGDALPCLGEVGHAAARWAATVEVSSPASAMAALAALFEVMGVRYRCTRAELWTASLTPAPPPPRPARSRSAAGKTPRDRVDVSKPALLFRCGVATVGAALDRHGGTLSRFFVPPERRGVSVPLTTASSNTSARRHHESTREATTAAGAASAEAELSMTLPSTATRQSHLPCVPRESSGANTMLPSATGTPQQPVLNEAVLDLNTSGPLRDSATTDAFASTTGASPMMMHHSRTNTFANTFDVVHLSALQVPEDANALDASKLLCISASTPMNTTSPSSKDGEAADAANAGAPLDTSAAQLVSVPSSTTKEKKGRPAELTSNPLLSVSPESTTEEERSHASLVEPGAAREESAGTATEAASTTTMAAAALQNASFVGTASPFTKQESLVTRWRYYVESGNCAIFDGATAGIKLYEFLGRGGSGLVYRGTYGSRHLPVAVKVLIKPDGMSHENYVRESLTDVAFYVLANQLNDFGISYNGRAHDFIISSVAPEGLPPADAAEARRNGDPATTKLCYFITDLMDGTIGRFLDANDDDFDPMYDQLQNSPLQACELFQFLFNQLAFKTLFDWRVLDLMLNNQLRGDNIGYRYVSLPPEQAMHLRGHPEEAAALALARQYYAGILYAFQFSPEEEVKYLRFPAAQEDAAAAATESNESHSGNVIGGNGKSHNSSSSSRHSGSEGIRPDKTPLRFICMIDVGQGTQPNIAELVRNEYIGESVVPSCVQDDGFGRFWPLDELYCRYVDVEGDFSSEVVTWGSKVRIHSQEDAFNALQELFARYYPVYGVAAPTEEELRTYLCLSWTPSNVTDLKTAYVYRAE